MFAEEFEYAGIQFSYNTTLATDVIGEHVPGEPTTHALPSLETGSPDHLRVSFDHNTAPGIFDPHDAQLLIFPVNEYRIIFGIVHDTIAKLQRLITEKPEAFEKPLPFLPPITTEQRFAIQPQYLDFQNGTGIRYITHYSRKAQVIEDRDIFYTYQGLTHDGQHYVTFVFPLVAEGLENPAGAGREADTSEENYNAYLEEAEQQLQQLALSDYVPDIVKLDALITSLSVNPKDQQQ